MIKNTSLLSIAITILPFSMISFSVDNNPKRYNEIVTALSGLSENFVFHSSDIQVVEKHTAALQKELDSHKNSWTPALLKVVGAGFALETVMSGVRTIVLSHTLATRDYTLLNMWVPIAKILKYPIYPIHFVMGKIQGNMLGIVTKWYYSYPFPSYERRGIISGCALAMSAAIVATGLTSKYLFDKANSYQAKIEQLEEKIKTDDAIITALQNR
jgi:hypothetical protein